MNRDVINEHYHGPPADPLTERARERIHWICAQATGRDILDIGCSQGIVSLILAREGFHCTGVDLELASIAAGQEALVKEDELVRQRVKLQVADAANLPFPDNSFDTVVLAEILEHLTHPDKVLAQAKRVLRSAGRLVVTVPYGLNAHPDHKRTFYPISLLELLQPLFRTGTITTLGNYIVYTGVKEQAYKPGKIPKKILFEQYLLLEKALEERCLAKERALLETNTKLYAKIKDLGAQSAEQASKLAQLQETLAAREKQGRETEANLDRSEALIAGLQERAVRAESALLAQASRIVELQETLAAKEDRIRQLEESGEQRWTSITELTQRVIRAEAESIAQANKVKDLQETIAARDTHISNLEVNLDQLRAAVGAQSERVIRAEADSTARGSRLKELEGAIAAKDNQIRSLEKSIDQERELAAAFRKDLMQAESAQGRLNAEVANARSELAAMEQRLAAAQQQNSQLQEDLAAKTTSFQRQIAQMESINATRMREREKQQADMYARREADWRRKHANERVREAVRRALPSDARVLVISKGDDDLLKLDGRYGMHFPQTTGGVYAGYHPANSKEAVTHLETLKAAGAEYLLIPASSFWWLDFYSEFQAHLDANYHLHVFEEGTCAIYALQPVTAPQPTKFIVSPREGEPPKPAKPANRLTKAAPVQTLAPSQKRGAEGNGTWPASLGIVLDEFTTSCFRPECRLVSFRPDNWKEVVEREKLDAVFVESAWRGNEGAWQYRVASYGRNLGDELADLLAWAKQQGIPSIFWNKEDPVHFERFIERAKLFSHVFTTDADCIGRYRDHVGHERVFALPFAAQPAIHNPIQVEPRKGRVCFAGTYYGDRHEQRQADMDFILRPAIPFGLEIYDRQHGMTGKGAETYRFPDIYQPCIKGRLDYEEMVKAYKRYRVFLNVNSVKQSPTMFSRRVFELLACGTPVISTYSRGIVDLLGEGIVFITESEADTTRHLERLLGDEAAWSRASVRGIRKVLREHTYRERLREVLEKAGLPQPASLDPRMSVLTRVPAGAELDGLATTLAAQKYRRFDVVLLSDTPLARNALERLRNALPDVIVVNLVGAPGDQFAPCLKASPAEYLAFLNLRDAYGPHYLMDQALALAYSNADYVGKHSFYEADGRGGSRLKRPGHEFQYVGSVESGSLVALKAALSKDLFTRGLNSRVFRNGKGRILSTDQFNYVQNYLAGKPLGQGAPGLAVCQEEVCV